MDKKQQQNFEEGIFAKVSMTGAQMGRAASAQISDTTLRVTNLMMLASGTRGRPEDSTDLMYKVAEALRSNMVVQIMAPLAAFVLAEHNDRGATCGTECTTDLLRTLFEEMIPSIMENAASLADTADKIVKQRVAEEMMRDEDRLTDKEREAVVKGAMDALASLMASGGKPN